MLLVCNIYFSIYSSPLGELFDHGIDSMAIWLIGVCVFSVFGQGYLSITMWEYYRIILVILIGFYMAHWEKYITGVLFLPWAYDFSQLVSSRMHFFSLYVHDLKQGFDSDMQLSDYNFVYIAYNMYTLKFSPVVTLDQ